MPAKIYGENRPPARPGEPGRRAYAAIMMGKNRSARRAPPPPVRGVESTHWQALRRRGQAAATPARASAADSESQDPAFPGPSGLATRDPARAACVLAATPGTRRSGCRCRCPSAAAAPACTVRRLAPRRSALRPGQSLFEHCAVCVLS
jgi:hypothetical protein